MDVRRPVPWAVPWASRRPRRVPWGESASLAVPLLAVLVPAARMMGTAQRSICSWLPNDTMDALTMPSP